VSNNFLEAQVAAERVPQWQQFQLAMTQLHVKPERGDKLLTSEIFLSCPGCGDSKKLDHVRAIDGIFLEGE